MAQANLGRGFAATKDMVESAKRGGYSVLLLQEPYVGTRHRLELGGVRVVQDSSGNEPPKSAIVLLDGNASLTVDQAMVTKNIVGAVVGFGEVKVAFLGAYLEGDKDIEEDLAFLTTSLQTLDATLAVVAGDLNAKSPWWGSDTEDRRGAAVAEFAAAAGLQVANVGTVPTFCARRQGRDYTSVVDVTLATVRLLPQLDGWRVDPGLTDLSDHRPIAFLLNLTPQPGGRPKPTTRIYDTKKADWSAFDAKLADSISARGLLPSLLGGVEDKQDLEAKVASFTESITEACGAIPPIRCGRGAGAARWWTPELAALKKLVNTKRNRIRAASAARRQWVWEDYMASRRTYKEAVQGAITRSWRTFCESQEGESVWQGIYRIIKNTGEYRDDQLLRNAAGGPMLPPQASVDLLADTFYPPDLRSSDTPQQATLRAEVREEMAQLDRLPRTDYIPFTRDELEIVLKGMDPRKAPGDDGFTSDIISRVFLKHSGTFSSIMNACLRIGHFPTAWKRAAVKIIPKPGKDDYAAPKSYRPIGLLPVLGKVLEKLFANRLTWTMGNRGLLSPRQYGFVPQRSTEDALYDALQLVEGALARKSMILVVSLDIEGAFDNAWWPGMVRLLLDAQVDHHTVRLVDSYLSERRIVVNYAGAKAERPTTKGCIQGSTCGPLLWNIQLNPLLLDADNLRAHVQAFADDILILAEGKDAGEVERVANEALERVSMWGRKAKMKFAAHKTQAILVTRKLKFDEPRVALDGVPIVLGETLKVLGLTIDKKLTFLPHIEESYRRAINLYKRVARTASAGWGLNSCVLRVIYRAVVEPTVLYAANVWGARATRVAIRTRLDRITRHFAILVAKAHRTTSLTAAAALSGVIPLDLRALEQLRLYEVKRGKPLLDFPGREMERRISPFDLPHPSRRAGIAFELIHNEGELLQIPPTLPQVYTDGSKLEGKVGGAVTAWDGGREVGRIKSPLAPYCSVYQAELFAITEALSLVAGKRGWTEAAILSDSRSSLEAIADSLHFYIMYLITNF